ncbi:MAG: Putative oxidoreductase ferredoxin-type protein, clusters with CPO [uncultured Sulfurovum sp.]|uniref:Glycolate oxidase iron-sulfur subunit n=1 Tax=uncultured Sulfurovum sp. TaxID=269237 RepID=A0A6S6TSJ7_9BACT|nr:MAG: Putative oxidoreductase ferredoxin-type protein, clusters with CPO [uncultured Sulfurovum sp.]
MSKSLEEIFNFQETADDCVKCGKCIPVCTIHQVNPDEVTSPRGFIDLLAQYQQGNLELDKNAKNIFESCFLCTNCVEVCPNDLATDMVIEEVRADIADKFGIAWFKRIAFYLLEHRKVMDVVMKFGFMFKTCAVAEDDKGRGLRARFSMPMVKKGRLLPSMSKVSFLNSQPEEILAPKQEEKNMRVALFIGCLANYNYVNIGDSLVDILKELNIDIFIPKDQLCCGAPAYFTGAVDSVERMTKANIEYFESFMDDCDAMLIPEATCSAMIKHDWQVFFKNHNMPEWEARAKKVTEKIHMATAWLDDNTELQNILKTRGTFDESVTYHDPCHARKVQGIYEQPRNLLAANYPMVEMSEPNRCCGFGGVTMQTEKFHFAEAAGKPKAAMIKNTKAHYVSAECSACKVQLSEAMNHAEVETIFKNPVELIAEALKK